VRKKVLFGVIAIVALLLLVAGATYAIFTANVQSDVQTFAAGTVAITVDGHDDVFTTTLHMDNMEAGDTSSQQITILNTGTLNLKWEVYVDWGWNPGDIFRCDGANSLNVSADTSSGNLAPNGSANVKLTALLPLAAGNSCQGKTGTVRVSVHAVQDSNLDGYTCMKLVFKDGASNWLPYQHADAGKAFYAPQHGNLCYKPTTTAGELHLVMNAYGLTPGANYQLALNGPGGCGFEDTSFATMPGDLFESGYWNGGPWLQASCGIPGEGVYNYDGVYNAVPADASGNISHDMVVTGLPSGTYNNVKYVVKEVTGALPGTAWMPKLMEIRQLNFTIIP